MGVAVDRDAPPGTPPRPLQHVVPEVTVNITWLVHQLSDQMQLRFAIDRRSDGCRTPRRNKEIDRALIELERLRSWSNAVANYFSREKLINGPGCFFIPAILIWHKQSVHVQLREQLKI